MKIPNILLYCLSMMICMACNSTTSSPTTVTSASDTVRVILSDTTIYTPYSQGSNKYENFHSPNAINKIARIENDYFQQYKTGVTSYFGTAWREAVTSMFEGDSVPIFQRYQQELGAEGDSMHCTIYAVEALKAGFGNQFAKLQQSHERIWRKREHAGWSLGYLLVKEWNWKAYLILDESSEEYEHCQKAYKRTKSYPVWRQPNIPLEKLLLLGKDNAEIQALLKANEFGWGFSHQGIHTWITRFNELKECNWMGAPSKRYEVATKPLFLSTPFLKYYDYSSHVIIFPPKQ